MCVFERLAKNKFPYHFLCKSFGKQTEMCIKLQQCNKLRDAKVQRNNADWDGDGEREMERDDQRGRPTVKYRGFPLPATPLKCSDMQKIACHCDGNATWTCPEWAPYPRGPPGRSTVFYVVRSLKNWQFDRSLCVYVCVYALLLLLLFAAVTIQAQNH